MNQQQKRTQSQRTRVSIKFIVGALSIGAFFIIGWVVFINLSNYTNSDAANGKSLNNGEIISSFTWESGEPTKATTGPDAIAISKGAYIAFGGRASTGGLAPGIPAKD